MSPLIKTSAFAIVVSRYNLEYTQGLLSGAQEVLKGVTVHVTWVPGAFEIPLQVQTLAKSGKYAAILAFGLVWQGKTAHAQEILRAVTDSLMRISLENEIPVIHEVLSVNNEKEARDRCLKKKLNRGREGAAAALSLLSLPMSAEVPKVEKVEKVEKVKVKKQPKIAETTPEIKVG
jgi:6,7-dimethyl-8-ribityllumazine synthase